MNGSRPLSRLMDRQGRDGAGGTDPIEVTDSGRTHQPIAVNIGVR